MDMNIFLNIILFIIGCVVGGECAIQARDIPKMLDWKKTHYSKKNKDNLISEMTYILIGGVSAVVLANVFELGIKKFDLSSLIIYIFAMIYVSTLVLIGGIDRWYSKIEKKTLAFGIVTSILYMLYLCSVDLASIHLNITYLAIYMILLVIDSFLLRRFAKDSYIVNLLLILTMILVFTDLKILIYTLIMASIAIVLQILLLNCQKKQNGNKMIKIKDIPVGFFVVASNVIVLFMVKIFESYII